VFYEIIPSFVRCKMGWLEILWDGSVPDFHREGLRLWFILLVVVRVCLFLVLLLLDSFD
jgi:hypothetical protein